MSQTETDFETVAPVEAGVPSIAPDQHGGVQVIRALWNTALRGPRFNARTLKAAVPEISVSEDWIGEIFARWEKAGYLKRDWPDEKHASLDVKRTSRHYSLVQSREVRETLRAFAVSGEGEPLEVLREHERRTAGDATTEKVETFLKHGPTTTPAAAEALGINRGSVWKALQRLQAAEKVHCYDADGQQSDLWVPAAWNGAALTRKPQAAVGDSL